MVMVDCSFCYFQAARGSIPRPLQIDAAIVSQAGKALFQNSVTHMLLVCLAVRFRYPPQNAEMRHPDNACEQVI